MNNQFIKVKLNYLTFKNIIVEIDGFSFNKNDLKKNNVYFVQGEHSDTYNNSLSYFKHSIFENMASEDVGIYLSSKYPDFKIDDYSKIKASDGIICFYNKVKNIIIITGKVYDVNGINELNLLILIKELIDVVFYNVNSLNYLKELKKIENEFKEKVSEFILERSNSFNTLFNKINKNIKNSNISKIKTLKEMNDKKYEEYLKNEILQITKNYENKIVKLKDKLDSLEPFIPLSHSNKITIKIFSGVINYTKKVLLKFNSYLNEDSGIVDKLENPIEAEVNLTIIPRFENDEFIINNARITDENNNFIYHLNFEGSICWGSHPVIKIPSNTDNIDSVFDEIIKNLEILNFKSGYSITINNVFDLFNLGLINIEIVKLFKENGLLALNGDEDDYELENEYLKLIDTIEKKIEFNKNKESEMKDE